MYDIHQLFEGAAALIEDERAEHITLYNRLFAVVSILNGDTVASFIDGDLLPEIQGRLEHIAEEYPIPSHHRDILYQYIEDHLEVTRAVLEALYELNADEDSLKKYIFERNEELVNVVIGHFPNYKMTYAIDYSTCVDEEDDPILHDLLAVPMQERDKKELEDLQRKLHGVFRDLYEDGPEKILKRSFYGDVRETLRLMVTLLPEKDIYGTFDLIDTSMMFLRRDISQNVIGDDTYDPLTRERMMEGYIREFVGTLSMAMHPRLGGEKALPLARKFNP